MSVSSVVDSSGTSSSAVSSASLVGSESSDSSVPLSLPVFAELLLIEGLHFLDPSSSSEGSLLHSSLPLSEFVSPDLLPVLSILLLHPSDLSSDVSQSSSIQSSLVSHPSSHFFAISLAILLLPSSEFGDVLGFSHIFLLMSSPSSKETSMSSLPSPSMSSSVSSHSSVMTFSMASVVLLMVLLLDLSSFTFFGESVFWLFNHVSDFGLLFSKLVHLGVDIVHFGCLWLIIGSHQSNCRSKEGELHDIYLF